MRYFLFLLMLLFAFSCRQEEQESISEPKETTKPAEKDVVVRQGADTLLTDDALLNRLQPSWTVEEVLQRLPGAEITERKPVENRHIPSRTDTLLTISDGKSQLQFYRLPDEDLLQAAVIKNRGLRFGERLEVGMPAEALPDMLPPLQGLDTLPAKIRLEGERVPRSLEISLTGGEVEEVAFQGYVD